MNTRTRIATAVATAALTLTAAPTANAHTTTATGVTCRSYTHPPYWLNGIKSDACDGTTPDNRFIGEAVATVDGNPNYGSTGPLQRCQVQLNRVINGYAYPMPGYNNSGVTYDNGLSCDVYDSWRLAAGTYNVTTSYEAGGTWYTTVQGPAEYYSG